MFIIITATVIMAAWVKHHFNKTNIFHILFSCFQGLPIIEDPDFLRSYNSFVGAKIPQNILPISKDNNGSTVSTTEKVIQNIEMRAIETLLKMVESLEKKIDICEREKGSSSDLEHTNPKFFWVQPKLGIIKPDIAKNLALFGKPFSGKH